MSSRVVTTRLFGEIKMKELQLGFSIFGVLMLVFIMLTISYLKGVVYWQNNSMNVPTSIAEKQDFCGNEDCRKAVDVYLKSSK
jgi:hypothetical protein